MVVFILVMLQVVLPDIMDMLSMVSMMISLICNSGTERLRIKSDGRIAIGTVSDYSATVTDAPVFISMKSNMTALDDNEGDATYGC